MSTSWTNSRLLFVLTQRSKVLRMLSVLVLWPQMEPCQALSGPEERPRRPEEGQLPPGSGTRGFRLSRRSASEKICSINLLKKSNPLVYCLLPFNVYGIFYPLTATVVYNPSTSVHKLVEMTLQNSTVG